MVARNTRFQRPKGYSRVSVKRDTNRFAEEEYFGEQSVRRFEQREPFSSGLDSPVAAMPQPREPEVVPTTVELPTTAEPQRRMRSRQKPAPSWFGRLWRRLFG